MKISDNSCATYSNAFFCSFNAQFLKTLVFCRNKKIMNENNIGMSS